MDDTPMKFIFKLSWFKTRRHTRPHTDMYFLKKEDIEWAFNDEVRIDDPINDRGYGRCEYIMVPENSDAYEMAIQSSRAIEDEKHPFLCMNAIPIENSISYARDYILTWARTVNNEFGSSGIDILLVKLTYDEIQRELVPLLQALGFDVYMYYTAEFDNDVLSVTWSEWSEGSVSQPLFLERYVEPFCVPHSGVWLYNKTTEEYHIFE